MIRSNMENRGRNGVGEILSGKNNKVGCLVGKKRVIRKKIRREINTSETLHPFTNGKN